ncbi:uncharacterized protein LOC114248772 [Bombyx mandarina]|uniref:Uncharacterized protein LOC114248772 n=1 Tax=Bombyx mandarina TaxID=7092 RepID=A0A6J2KAN0_BOMMA|nr:uncharacterized protein LOC114248772 [Bombyx mandarina]
MVKRFNQTLERYLAKFVENRQRDRNIQPLLLSYRSAVHKSTTVTPALANFWRELRLPTDLITGTPPDTPCSVTEYANDLRSKMNEVHEYVRQSGQQASSRMKTRYDRKANHQGFADSSLMLATQPSLKQREVS